MGFLEKLVEQKIINRYQLNDILEKAKEMSGDIDRVMELYKIPDDAVRAARSSFFGVPEAKVPDVIDTELLGIIPVDAARNYRFAPISQENNILKIGMVDPSNLEARNALQFIASQTNIPFEAYVISFTDFNRVMGMYNGFDAGPAPAPHEGQDEVSNLEKDSIGAESSDGISFSESFDTVIKKTDSKKIVEDAPATKILAVILKNAVEGGASDVHIEPTGTDVRIRYRVDGILHVSLRTNKNMHDSLIARLKTMTNTMKLDEKRKPQDGRFMAFTGGRKIDFRLSILPTFFGEKAVIRILDSAQGIKKLDDIGMGPEHVALVRKTLELPYGLILITGPTGSGKSTTLYSMLNEVDRERLNVISLEDPVEYNIAGVSQSQVRPEIGYTFAAGLRSILRQDPDVIMVGEIRDKETAELAINAALTGHLVLATLHTNNSIGVIPRLVDMGVDPYLIAPTLVLSIAQRLAQKFIPGKGVPVAIEGAIANMLEKQFADLPAEFRPKITATDHLYEIPKTSEVSLHSRMPVFEMFAMDKQLQTIMLKDPTENAIYDYVRARGMLTMREDAIIKSMQGIIPWSEINTL
jgi:type II secretory ATPase GspE/PulE/Tfp pilus assembly ATPase PilB-like protein